MINIHLIEQDYKNTAIVEKNGQDNTDIQVNK